MRLYLWFLLAYLSVSLVLTTGLTFLLPQKNLAYFLLLGLFRLVALWYVYRHFIPSSPKPAFLITAAGHRNSPWLVFLPVLPAICLLSYGLWFGAFAEPSSIYLWPILIMVLLPAALAEEITFRGRLFTSWASEPGKAFLPVCISSVLFAGAHFSVMTSAVHFLYYFLGGCVFALNRVHSAETEKSQSLTLAMNVTGHFLWNSLLLLCGLGLSDVSPDIFFLPTSGSQTFDKPLLYSLFWLAALIPLLYSHLTQCLKKSL